MKQPKISVVIPLYNKASHITSAIASIMRQRYPVSEIIVVDDGSTDNGADIVANMQLQHIRLIQQENQGVSAARNTGIEAAQYDYIAFLDADDEWLPFFTEDMYSLIQKYPETAFYTSRYQCVEPGDKYVDAKISLDLLCPEGMLLDNYFDIASRGDLPFMISSSLIHKSVFEEIGGFPVGEKIGEDQDLFVRFALKRPIAYSPTINLLYHRDAENRACERNVPARECPFSERLHQHVNSRNQDDSLTLATHRYSAAHICHLAKLNILGGKFATADRLLSDPRCKLKPKHYYGLKALAHIKRTQMVCGAVWRYLTRQPTRIQS